MVARCELKAVEYLIDFKDQWYIVHLAFVSIVRTPDGGLRAAKHDDTTGQSICWVERDGSVLCLQGEEYRTIDLREV